MSRSLFRVCLVKQVIVFTLAWGLSATASAAIDAVYTGFFSNDAIDGYDAVAYFTEGRPVEGSDEFSLEYQGATWKFSSQRHLEMFQADPQAYAPQYGGYCAYAVSQGDTASAEPDLWTIHDGKLYLNFNRRINERWKADMAEYIRQADANWPTFELEQ